MTQKAPFSADEIDSFRDSLDCIAAVSDLIAVAGTYADQARLAPRTVARAALLIESEARKIREILDHLENLDSEA